jgi:Cu+-exporting ATPase
VRITLPVDGMTCAACQANVQRALTATPGVAKANVNLMTHEATVHYDTAATSAEKLVAAINDTGYVSRLPDAGVDAAAADQVREEEQRHEYTTVRTKAIVSLILGAAAMIVSMPLMSSSHAAHSGDLLLRWTMRLDEPVRRVFPFLYTLDPGRLLVVLFVATTLVMLWAGRHFYVRAWKGLQHRNADMNTLIAIGTGAAYLYSIAATFAPQWFAAAGTRPDVYYEAVIIIIALVLVGNAMEARAKTETTRALRQLARLQPSSARVRRDGREQDLPTWRHHHRAAGGTHSCRRHRQQRHRIG